ncbi:MAG: c-type cytochrome [Verrucomicrobiota bacterium]|nr:c-type cytochrome [Verrucomicrobiota bacterium]
MATRATVLALFLGLITPSIFALPDWIWIDSPTTTQEVVFHHGFDVQPAGLQSAHLRLAADFATVKLTVNGRQTAIAEAFGPVLKLDVLPLLLSGTNEIRLMGKSVGDAPAVALQLDLIGRQGRKRAVATSSQWQTTTPGVRMIATGDLGLEKWWMLPPLVIGEIDDYTQWKRAKNLGEATDPGTFQLLPGYRAELLRSAGKNEGSWVSMAFDPEGRLTIAREDKGLTRFTFSRDFRKVLKAETINDDLMECRGLLYAHGSLYVNANNSKALYRLRDTDGDSVLDHKKLLHASKGGVGHGRNDLAMGADQKIYAIHGDSVHLPASVPDRTSPLRRKYNPFRENEGHVIRMNPDGSNREIFCGGLRNPYGIDFNTDGEAFTYDADAEFDMGTPWYRPTQVKHLTSGADFGWRAVTGSWPPYFPDHPDNTQAAIDIGKGSPTGVKFGTRSHFPVDYQRALYLLDWTYGRILAAHLIPRGSSYIGATEVFLRGQPLNATDLDFGPDGAMYFITGGRKTQSGLYRVSYTGPTMRSRKLSAQEKHRNRLTHEYRQQRKLAESFHRKAQYSRTNGLHDPRIRQAWRIASEHNPDQLARLISNSRKENATAKAETNLEQLTAIANAATSEQLFSLLGLDDPAAKKGILFEYKHWDKLPLSRQLAFIDLIRRSMERHQFPAAGRDLVLATLNPHFPHNSPAINRALAPLLIELTPHTAVPQTIALLDGDIEQQDGLFYLYHLRHTKAGWTTDLRRTFFRILGTYETFLGGRGLPLAFKNIRREALETLTAKEKKQYAEFISQPPVLPPMPDLTGRGQVRQWKGSDFEGKLGFNASRRNLANGRRMFATAFCSRCHRYGEEGYPIGPDLTRVASRFSREALLDEILLPSRTIAENYRIVLLNLKDGRQLAGQIIPNLDYRAPNLQLAEDPLHPDKITRIPKHHIINQEYSTVSLMPPGMLNILNQEEILDLLAWLEQGAKMSE